MFPFPALPAASPAASRIDLNLSSGPRREVHNGTGASPAGTWSGPDGIGSVPATFFGATRGPAQLQLTPLPGQLPIVTPGTKPICHVSGPLLQGILHCS